jgi:hypothetical protein
LALEVLAAGNTNRLGYSSEKDVYDLKISASNTELSSVLARLFPHVTKVWNSKINKNKMINISGKDLEPDATKALMQEVAVRFNVAIVPVRL